MKNFRTLASLLIAITLCDFLIAAPVDPLTNELSRIQGVYATALVAIDVKYQALLTNVPTQYFQGLDKLEKGYQQKGEFKSVMAIRVERDKVNSEFITVSSDSDTDPKELKDLKVKVRVLPSQISEQKSKEQEALAATYFARLEELQRDLTKAGRITHAAAVQAELDRIKEGQKAVSPSETSSSKPTQIAPMTGEAPGVSPSSGFRSQREKQGKVKGPKLWNLNLGVSPSWSIVNFDVASNDEKELKSVVFRVLYLCRSKDKYSVVINDKLHYYRKTDKRTLEILVPPDTFVDQNDGDKMPVNAFVEATLDGGVLFSGTWKNKGPDKWWTQDEKTGDFKGHIQTTK